MADDNVSTLKWRGDLDISQAKSLYEELETALEAGQSIELDTEGVDRVDTASLQLLCAFWEEARNRCLEVKWKAVSDPLMNTAKLLDLVSMLGLGEDPVAAEES